MKSPDAIEAAPVVRRAVQRLSRRLRAERPRDGLPVIQLSLLAYLMDSGAQTSAMLARRTRTTPQALTRPLDALHRAGLIDRRPDPYDGRQHMLTITEKGLGALAADALPRDAWLSDALDALLSDAERDVLVVAASLLDRLSAHTADAP